MKQLISLNGQWDFVADLDPKYHEDKTIYPSPSFARPDANRRHWQTVPVPGVWQKYGERYDIFEGVCWFAREFEVQDLQDVKSCLRFGGVNYVCQVYLNGHEIGGHETGYTEFVLDTAGFLQFGTNHIAVRVDNRATTTKWPPCLGYFNYGGIHRDVTLEISKGACLEDIVVNTEYRENGGKLAISGKISDVKQLPGSHSIEKFELEISLYGNRFHIFAKDDGSFSVDFPIANIKPWSPVSPNLYPLSIHLILGTKTLDIYETQCGFRKVEVQGGKIHLNGKPLKLNGICYVYDSSSMGLVMTPEQVQADVAAMKEMGCNAVRCHYPMDKEFYKTCDQAGIMVWIEPTVYCLHPLDDDKNTPFSNPEWIRLAEQMITEMIRVARNHPSVAIYGIGNECNTENAEAEAFFRRLAQKIREEDSTRIISYAALYGIVGKIAEIVDVLGINSYWGWYDKIFGGKGLKPEKDEWQVANSVEIETIDLTPMREMLDQVLERSDKNLVLLLTEFGADSVPGYYANSRDLWSENYHADLLRDILQLADEYPQIAGTFPFCFSDYRDPSKVHNGYWNELNLKGVVTYERKKRLAFDAVRKVYKHDEVI